VSFEDLDAAVAGEATLESTRDKDVGRRNGSIQEDQVARVAEHTGREFTFTFSSGATKTHVRERIVLVGQRLYRIAVGGSAEEVRSARAERFLDSFRLLPEKTPPV
jgi:hypothetical protein